MPNIRAARKGGPFFFKNGTANIFGKCKYRRIEMKYLEMLPRQIRKAIDSNVPVVLPIGVIEYHAEHLPVGVDTFVCQEVIRRVEKKHPEMVVLPTFYYGSASYAVAKPERNGSVQVDSAKIIPMAEEIFTGLLRVGFRNIHCFIAHQDEEFEQGMPTDLAFRTAGRRVIFNWLEKETGEGWWGTEQYSNYYSGSNNPFHWIMMHPVKFLPEDDGTRFETDHAGLNETSQMLVINPGLVEKERIDGTLWYAKPGKDATAEYGEASLDSCAKMAERILFGKE